MLKHRPTAFRVCRGGAAAAALLLLTSVAAGADPAVRSAPPGAPPGHEGAYKSFDQFATDWMQKMERAEAHGRAHPRVQAVAGRPALSYRGYDDKDFQIELKTTGHAQAPYVGILRYRESLYQCADQKATQCSVAETTPVTEIFRFQNGRWVY
jgi:hypothetical protein